ncbi:hypothetical protein SLEP1_g27448 [Rubroshorea leprosula]|uniref:Uncharacterized protein n=1 Tax=Rubroshorea leprosula TaxID=152421 RepID=A0AAV5JWX7_9ROSI|nr:hypothetical protein SLEP1_g27448 [Rubroshorea leprosula]
MVTLILLAWNLELQFKDCYVTVLHGRVLEEGAKTALSASPRPEKIHPLSFSALKNPLFPSIYLGKSPPYPPFSSASEASTSSPRFASFPVNYDGSLSLLKFQIRSPAAFPLLAPLQASDSDPSSISCNF